MGDSKFRGYERENRIGSKTYQANQDLGVQMESSWPTFKGSISTWFRGWLECFEHLLFWDIFPGRGSWWEWCTYQNLTKGHHTLGKEIADQCIKSRPILIEEGHLSINGNQMNRTMLESPVKAQTSPDVPILYLSLLSILM